jgi:selT/selW/selH-like putative selenoprotein
VSKIINEIDPNITIDGNKLAPRNGAFEVKIDSIEVFSKLKKYQFPTTDEVKGWF